MHEFFGLSLPDDGGVNLKPVDPKLYRDADQRVCDAGEAQNEHRSRAHDHRPASSLGLAGHHFIFYLHVRSFDGVAGDGESR
jgi:hypothetical protein